MAIKALLQSLLVEKVTNESDGAAEDEQSVQTTILDHTIGFLIAKSTAATQKVDKTNRNATIHVENQVGLLLGCHLLHGESKL